MTTVTSTATRVAARAVHATKVYGSGSTEVRALDDVTVDLPGGRFTAVMGPSGSGKSTLMHCVAGLDTLTSGQVFLGPLELGTLSDKELTVVRREQVGFVFQAFNLLPTLTALENVTLPISLAGGHPDREWVDRVIDIVGLRDRLTHRPSELSGGQQQRVAIARALANAPALLIADEPTGQLDAETGHAVMELLRAVVRSEQVTALVATHDATLLDLADRVLELRDGEIVEQ